MSSSHFSTLSSFPGWWYTITPGVAFVCPSSILNWQNYIGNKPLLCCSCPVLCCAAVLICISMCAWSWSWQDPERSWVMTSSLCIGSLSVYKLHFTFNILYSSSHMRRYHDSWWLRPAANGFPKHYIILFQIYIYIHKLMSILFTYSCLSLIRYML